MSRRLRLAYGAVLDGHVWTQMHLGTAPQPFSLRNLAAQSVALWAHGPGLWCKETSFTRFPLAKASCPQGRLRNSELTTVCRRRAAEDRGRYGCFCQNRWVQPPALTCPNTGTLRHLEWGSTPRPLFGTLTFQTAMEAGGDKGT
ncbi:Myomesin-3 [Manis pentadactyla]|nr:Myomesin-3 [Manis pentadactyla]